MTAQDFKRQIFSLFFQDVHRIEQNNYAPERYSFDGVDRSNIFDVSKHVKFLDWFSEKYQNVYTAWSRLADEESQQLYVDILRYRLSGHLHVRIRSNVEKLKAEIPAFQASFVATPSAQTLPGMFGNLVHYEGSWQGERYIVDTVKDSLVFPLLYNQYFFSRGPVRIMPQLGDHVMDAGAFTGESSVAFARRVGEFGRVYAFDPVDVHQNICRVNFEQQEWKNILLFPYAVGDKNIDAPPATALQYNPGYHPSEGSQPIATRRIDDLVFSGEIERIDFLKMDVEGAELEALRGALGAIKFFKPKLALSIYHRPDDFFEIVNFIHDLDLGYRLFIDHHTIFDEETVLYAVVAP